MTQETLDVDFSDGAAPPKKKMHPGARKNLIIVGVVATIAVVLTVTFSFMGSASKSDPTQNLRAGRGTDQTRDVTDQRYAEAEQARQQQLLRSAQEQGNSFLGASSEEFDSSLTPADLSLTDDINPDVAKKDVAPRLTPDRRKANVGNLQADQSLMVQARQQAVLAQMQLILADQIPMAHTQTPYVIEQAEQPQLDRATQPVNPQGASGTQDQAQSQQKPPGYTNQLFKSAIATLDKPISTDRDSLVIATIRSGPYEGARIQGLAKRDLDQMKIEFTRMTFNNQSYQINATGLDEMTLSTLVDGRYDGNYTARFVAPFLFSTVSAIADARSQVQQETIVGAQGQIVQTTPAPSTDQAIASGIRDGIRTAATVFAENVKPPTVNSATNSAIAVIWLN